MARASDGDELLGIERLLDTDVVRQSKTASWLLDQVLHDIQAMPTLKAPNEWVSVEERLPEVNKPVLVYCDGGFAVSYIFDTDMLTGNPVWNYTGLGGDPWYWTTIPTPPYRRPPEGEEDT